MGNAKSVLKLGASSSGILGESMGPDEQAAIKNTKLYSFQELSRATGDFALENRIGEGGFGYTYKGVLPDGTLIAVKVRSRGSAQGNEEFMNEILMLAKLKHVNLVRLYGCCLEADHVILVYNYLQKGDLARALFGDGLRGLDFPWDVRRRICRGVAEGLSFLHAADIVHRDITASNVLLDDELNPKIGDFGLARFCHPDKYRVSEPRIAGTYGYMAPEYALNGLLTVKADTYSFGVLMLEIVSGRRNRNTEALAKGRLLLDKAWDLHERGELLGLVDKSIMGDFDMKEAYRYLIICLVCTQHDPDLRPDMSAVIGMLTGKIDFSGDNLSRQSFLSRNISPRADEGVEQDWGSHFSFSPATIDSDDQLVGTELVNVVNEQKFERSSGSTSQSHLENEGTILMRVGLGLTEAPKTEEWLSAKEIYLMQSQVAELPESPRCPRLKALYMHRNYKLRRIPISFFEYMPVLQVLNLSRTRIKTLPDSLFGLRCLKRLFLNHCELLAVLSPKIGELKELEVLDLHGTEIIDLPKEIVNLTNLRCLELSFCCHFDPESEENEPNVLIPKGSVSALSQLEELSIDVDPEDQRWENDVGAILNDIHGLRMLSTLKLYLPYVENLMDFNWYRMPIESFKFTVGRRVNRIMSRFPRVLTSELERWDKCLEYVNGVSIPIGIKKVLYHSTAFFLDRHANATSLSEFGIENLGQLKCCVLGECNEVRYILDDFNFLEKGVSYEIVSEYSFDEYILGSLEYLHIYYMRSLRGIYTGPYRKCLCNLKSLTLQTCPKLATIFTPELLGNLTNLEELIVEDCEYVTSLVTRPDSSMLNNSSFLPNLRRMSLHDLPQLVSISHGLHIGPKLELFSLRDCPKLSLSMGEVGSKHLTKIKGTSPLLFSSTPSFEAEESGSSREKSLDFEAKSESTNPRQTPHGPRFSMSPSPRLSRLGLVQLDFNQVLQATRNFSPSMKIGEGAFGIVYKAKLENGQVVAVKRAKREHFKNRENEFSRELELLSKIDHQNLVKLLGFIDKGDERLIITEYVPNGTLRVLLDGNRGRILDFNERLGIAIDVAHGLTYLHLYSEKQIIHGDVKSSHILLTDSMRAKVADFGFGAKGSEEGHISTVVKGTVGYLDPEYMISHQLTAKSDVYSFGILLLEILTGRQPVEIKRPTDERITLRWVFKKFEEGNVMGLVDPKLEEAVDGEILLRFFELAIQCAAPVGANRPDMKTVGEQLWGMRVEYHQRPKKF